MVIINRETGEKVADFYPAPMKIWHGQLFTIPSSVTNERWMGKFGEYISTIISKRGTSVAMVQLKREYMLYEQAKKRKPSESD